MTRPLALLLHSGGLTSRQWRKLVEQLAATHDVVAPDLLGYGDQPWPPGEPFHFRQDVDRLIGLIDGLDIGPDIGPDIAPDIAKPEMRGRPVDIVGHSYGGLLGLQLALALPERVQRLALYEPVAFGVLDDEDAELRMRLGEMRPYRGDGAGVDEAWLETFIDWWNGPGAWRALPGPTRAGFRAVAWKLSQEVGSLIADTTGAERYAQITAPTLLLGGQRTPRTEQRTLERLAAALPHARLELLPDMGHMGPITHAGVVNAQIAAHLAGP